MASKLTKKLFSRYYTIYRKKPEINYLNITLKFLKQLHTTIFRITNFENKCGAIVQHKRDTVTTHLYFISYNVTGLFAAKI